MRLALDRSARRLDGGRLLVAGSPLSSSGWGRPAPASLDAIAAGDDPGPAAQPLVERLLDAGAIHPRPVGGRFGPATSPS